MASKFPFTVRSVLLTAGLALLAAPASAQQAEPAPAPGVVVTPQYNEAETLLLKMADTLGKADAFGVHLRTGYDTVQVTGQKIQYLETRDLLVKRPDKLRIESKRSDGGKGLMQFDGKTISVTTESDNVYAQAEKTGTVDEAVRYFRKDLGMHLPLAAMLLTTLRQELEQRMSYAEFVETAEMCDGKYQHIAARGEEIDMQVWIAVKGPALPKRIVLTYKHAEGQPQFWADFSDWDLSPWASDSKFTFKAPKGARKIAFLPQVASVTSAVNQ